MVKKKKNPKSPSLKQKSNVPITIEELSPDVLEFLKDKDKMLLSFSGGKDSLCAWCVLRELGIEVAPYYMNMIPGGMSWVNDYLDYVERKFDTKILRVQHPQPYTWLKTFAGQPPHRYHHINALNLPRFSYEELADGVRRTMAIRTGDESWYDVWEAVGTRATDSLWRRTVFKRHGWLKEEQRKAYIIHNVNKDSLIKIIKRHDVKLSPCYKYFGISFDGVHYRFAKKIKENFPDDWARIKKLMPMQEAELMRVHFGKINGTVTEG